MTQTAQTREALVEVMARLLDATETAGDYPTSLERVKTCLSALEAAGVRLVPADATFQMYDATKDHCEQTNSAGDPPNPFRIWNLMLSASPYNAKDKP